MRDLINDMPWGALAAVIFGSSVISAWVTHGLSQRTADAQARRNGYAAASRVLIQRAEYPYRIRRRSSNEPDVVSALVELGHTIQENVTASRVWVKSESPWVGGRYEAALAAIDAKVADSASEAWEAPPITVSKGMRLGAWGPGDCTAELESFEQAVIWRFGWRRLVPGWLARHFT